MPTYGQRSDTQSQVDEHITDSAKTSAKKVLMLGRDDSDVLQDVKVDSNGYGYNIIVDEGGIPAEMDNSTHSLQTIDYEHHEIHSGSHYFICNYKTFGNGEVFDFTFVTPDTEQQVHLLFSVYGTAALSIEALVGAVVNVAGTVVTSVNNNGNSLNTSNVVVRNGDTFTSEGVSKLRSYAGANKAAGIIARGQEIILARNTVYILRITNETTSNIISWDAEWYEHTPKD